jgi:hypothetical protein
MSDQEKMTIEERYKYLRMMKKRYQKADKQEKGRLLIEMEAITGQHRKSLIRAMNSRLERQPRRTQRRNSYGPEVDDALGVLAETMNYICAERLTPKLASMARHLVVHKELAVSPQLLMDLECISVPTVRRHLQRLAQDQPRLSRPRPTETNTLRRDIPMKRLSWQESQPGHVEVDLVHHCGQTASGEYLHTLQMIDVATGWSERVAVLGRSYRVMEAGFQHCLARLPFPLREIHPDNGAEFFNRQLLRFFDCIQPPIQLSRSRPYHKNDNRFVEQKNATLVREFLGYDRFDTAQHTNLLNHIYDLMWLYYNFFQPVMRLEEKTSTRDDSGGLHVTRKFDTSQTPFERLCASQTASELDLRPLHALYQRTNPRQLRRDIYALLDQFFTLPTATPGVSENVFDTFPIPLTFPKGEQDSLVTLSNDRTIHSR